MDQKALFRKAAIDKLASPEQLDVLMKVTSPKGWLALITVALLLVGVIIWSVVGELPSRVPGQGILAVGDFFPVDANASGTLVEILVEERDRVVAGQVVARIEIPDIDVQIRNAEATYQNVQGAYSRAQGVHQTDVRGWDLDTARIQSLIADQDQQRIVEEAKLDNPNYPQNTVQRTLGAIRQTIATYETQIETIARNERSGSERVEQTRMQRDEARIAWETLRDREGASSMITTAVGGTVIAVNKQVGDSVRNLEVVIRVLQEHEEGMMVRFYVDSLPANEILTGQEVEISPTSIRKEEFGFLRGVVIDRSDDVITQAQLVRELGGNDARAGDILSTGPKKRVIAKLYSAETPTGYLWSSGVGYGQRLETISEVHEVDVNVVVSVKRPIDLVIPRLTSAFGL